MFPVVLVVGLVLAGSSALVRLGASDQGTQPKDQTARKAYDLLAEGFGPGFNAPIPIVVDVNGDEQAPAENRRGRARPPGCRLRRRARLQRPEDRRHRLREAGLRAAGRGDGAAGRHPAERRHPGGDRGRERSRVRLRPDGGVRGHRRPHHGASAVVPAVRHRGHVPRARDGVPLDRGLADGRRHDDPLRLRRLRRADARGAGGPPALASRD